MLMKISHTFEEVMRKEYQKVYWYLTTMDNGEPADIVYHDFNKLLIRYLIKG